MRTVIVMFAGCVFVFAAGCENNGARATLADEINTLKRGKTQLLSRIEKSKSENEQLKKQIQVLAGIRPQARAENLSRSERIKITGYTNLYDKDKDGKKEKLLVYIQPIDQDGDVIKAAGQVDVQIWDLSKEADQAMLGQWHVNADELRKLWFATWITINYRLTFDVADIIDKFEEPLTVKVTFTDYLTGRVFKEQKVIKPR